MAIYGPKPLVNPFGKMSIFLTFWTSSLYSLETRFFVLEFRERDFPGLYRLKKQLEKWPFLEQNHVNPFKNMSFFRLFEFLVFVA